MKKLSCIFRDRPTTDEEVRSQIREIRELSSTNAIERKNVDRSIQALRGVVKILRRTNRSQLQLSEPREILTIVVRIIIRLDRDLHAASKNCHCNRRRHCKKARSCYRAIVDSYLPEKTFEFIRALVEVIHVDEIWRWEDLCRELVGESIDRGIGGAPIINEFLNLVQSETREFDESRAILRIIYRILDNHPWPNNNETTDVVERLLEFYRKSLTIDDSTGISMYAGLRRGFEVCVRHAIKNLENDNRLSIVRRMCVWSIDREIDDVAILNYGGTLEYAAHVNPSSGLYKDILDEELFVVLMRMLASSNRLVSLLGNRVLQCLIDRAGNRGKFNTPKIFFENTCFDVKINRCDPDDKYFLQKNRRILHDSIVESMMNHCTVLMNLESTYCTICLIAAEVPCGFTAAAVVCLAMNLQDLTLERSEIYRQASYHVHAVVIAVMSVLCWIHDAKVFYDYVNVIVMKRAQWAPHLNPPVKPRYSFAVHHVLWNKPELFFVDWETRYGLWKCFRLRDDRRKKIGDDCAKKN